MKKCNGKPASPGMAMGRISIFENNIYVPSPHRTDKTEKEMDRFHDAMKTANAQLAKLYEKLLESLNKESADIIRIQQTLLEDEIYVTDIENLIREGYVSEFAVYTVGKRYEEIFAAMDDEYLRARSVDIVDISDRIVKILKGDCVEEDFGANEPFILFAEDLTPSQTVQIDKKNLLAFVTVKGSVNSHTAILARSLNVPAVVCANVELNKGLFGKTAVVDGKTGEIIIEPSKDEIAKAQEKLKHLNEEISNLQQFIYLEDVTSHGQKIDVFCNIGNPDDCDKACKVGASGIGLFRTEFLYLGKSDWPGEEEQFQLYKEVVEKMAPKKVVIRTIDIGADKELPYFPVDEGKNPALGFRAIRLCLQHKEILHTQLRAILRASAFGNVGIMFPMIVSLWEVDELRKIFDEVKFELKKDKCPVGNVEFGIMIETPAAALIADDLAKKVDFFSLGTNDLTQYTLAIDRQNQLLDAFFDSHHPAVIKLIEMTAKAARDNGIWVGICGELAGDLSLTETFLEIGINELSVSPAQVLLLRKKIREL